MLLVLLVLSVGCGAVLPCECVVMVSVVMCGEDMKSQENQKETKRKKKHKNNILLVVSVSL